MNRGIFTSWIFGLLFPALTSAQPYYHIIGPKAFRPGSVYNVSAICFNVDTNISLTLTLRGSDSSILATQSVILYSGMTNISSLEIPSFVPSLSYSLIIEGTGELNFSRYQQVGVIRKTLSLFVQTDKAVYKPGQRVLFRVIATHPDLKPYQGLVDINIFDSKGNKIMQWLKQKNNTGVIEQSLLLSDQTAVGDWKISLTAWGNSYTKNFTVSEYVLPKFSVAVHLPSYYLVNLQRRDIQGNLYISVMAIYTYGQPVKGRAKVAVSLTGNYVTSNATKMVDVELNNGKADIILTIDDLLALVPSSAYDGWYYLSTSTISVTVDVNETVTGIVLSGSATVDCTSRKYHLTFMDLSPNNFKPGLVYWAFLQLAQVDGAAPDLSDIQLSQGDDFSNITAKVTFGYPAVLGPAGAPCPRNNPVGNVGPPGATDAPHGPGYPCNNNNWYYPTSTSYVTVTVTSSGYMNFSIEIPNDVINVDLMASFNENATNSVISASKSIKAFQSRDKQAVQVSFNSPDGVVRPYQEATFNVTTTQSITTFQYEILGKGSIQLSDSIVGAPSTEHFFSIFITRDFVLKLAPVARVIVWFVTSSGEIITDSLQLSVADGFANQVSLSFDTNMTLPSQNVSLTVHAYSGSYIGLLAVDQSALLMKGGNDLSENMISQDLKSYDTSPIDYGYGKRRKRDVCCWWGYYADGVDSSDILNKAGVFIVTNGYLHNYYPSYPYYPSGPMGPTALAFSSIAFSGQTTFAQPMTRLMTTTSPTRGNEVEESQPRVKFPETWIWSNLVSGPDGQATLTSTIPDTITSWIASAFAVSEIVGLGVAENTAKVTVFKQFFLSPNLPYSVRRGEEFGLQVTVFNYLSDELKVTVNLDESDYFIVKEGASKLVKVGSNDAASVSFWIVPKSLGQIPITIKAKSPAAGDAMTVMLLVKPEGLEQKYSTSLLVQLSPSVPTYNSSLNISLPPVGQLVPGSEFLEVTVFGDLLGSSIKGSENLLQMPYGCGEQNMLNFAPDVYIVKYLKSSNQLTSDILNKAVEFMLSGYQKELTYQRSDGSFSAFGNSDKSGSVWLSSFVIKCFHQAMDYIPIDNGNIALTMQWIIANQAPNGSFAEPPFGQVIHVEMQGGSSRGLPLTAYTLIALLENQNNSQVDSSSLKRSIAMAQVYLEQQVSSVTSDAYALSIMAYALVRANSSKVAEVLQKLDSLAIVEGGMKHWEKAPLDSGTSPYWQPPYLQARSFDIETAAYVLLTYCQLNEVLLGLPIAKWIIKQRNAYGGFSSTQDTVMALEALAIYATILIGPSGVQNAQVSISAESVKHDFLSITADTALLLQSYQIPSNSSTVFLSAAGNGAALIQLNVKFNVYKTEDDSGITLNVTTTPEENIVRVESCSRWNKAEGSGMVVMEFNLLTGFRIINADDLKNQSTNIKRVETTDDKIVPYFDELTSEDTCIVIYLEKFFPVGNVAPAPIKVYPYYDPSKGKSALYGAPEQLSQESICTVCPECCAVTDEPQESTTRRTTPLRARTTKRQSTLPGNRNTLSPPKSKASTPFPKHS